MHLRVGTTPRRQEALLLLLISYIVEVLSTCTPRDCQLPACFCPGLTPPADIPVDQIPQMVMLTFDDAVLPNFDIEVYQRIFNRGSSSADGKQNSRRRSNPNGCPIAATFYVSHNWTDYDLVRRLHLAGHEMASHSVSHRMPQSYWTSASHQNWREEIAGQRDNIIKKARLNNASPASSSHRRSNAVVGMRAPFLETGGDEQFKMMRDEQFVYDSSMMTGPHQAGAVWPFTLDFSPSVEFCSNNRCPKRSAPGLWELPLNRWIGRDGRPCAMVDSCDVQPISKGDALSYFWHNFGRFYRGNRAPFGIHLHPDWLLQNTDYFSAFETFIDSLLTDMNDVYFVTASQVIEWMKDPQTVDKAPYFAPWKTSCGGRQNSVAETASRDSSESSQLKYQRFGHLMTLTEENDNEYSDSTPQLKNDIQAQHEEPIAPRYNATITTTNSHSEIRKTNLGGKGLVKTDSTNQIEDQTIQQSEPLSTSHDLRQHNSSSTEQQEVGFDENRGPRTASHRRSDSAQGETLNNYVDKVNVYEEPIGELAEQTSVTISGREQLNRRTQTPLSTMSLPRYPSVTQAKNPSINEFVIVGSTTSPNVRHAPALFHRHIENVVSSRSPDNPAWHGSLRRAGDISQLKSGPVDDHAWEDVIQREPLHSVSPSSSRSLSPSLSSAAAAAEKEADAKSTAIEDSRNKAVEYSATLPAAVVSAGVHMTSSSCGAVSAVTWAWAILTTMLTLIFGNRWSIHLHY